MSVACHGPRPGPPPGRGIRARAQNGPQNPASMSPLILFLPPGLPGPATEYSYTLTADGHHATGHASSPAALLPEPARRAAEVVAVVPARALSWQRLLLPPGLPLGAGQQTPRLRSALEGLLEDRVLDDVGELHFAIEPGAQVGQALWVA